MVSDTLFSAYLKASLPEQYPITTVPLSLHMRDAELKELIYQQSQFLELAKTFLNDAPCISYVAALKHLLMLLLNKIDTASFREIHDKEYFDRINGNYKDLAEAAKKQLDPETETNCQRLVALQCVATKLNNAIDIAKQATSEGFLNFESEPPKPEAGSFSLGCVTFILVAIVLCVFTAIGDAVGGIIGLGMALMILIGGILAIKKVAPQQKKFDRFVGLRDSFNKNTEELLPLLDLDRSAISADLIKTLGMLDGLQNIRTEYQEKYLRRC
jgi:hypothetical protein